MTNDWKKRLGVVYSTNPDFDYNTNEQKEEVTLSPEKQNLRISIDNRKRKGKVVTLVTGFVGTEEDLKALGKKLKMKCGLGGTVKNNEIVIQGNVMDKIKKLLQDEGYNVH